MSVYHHGKLLTAPQLKVLEGMTELLDLSPRKMRERLDKALEAAGCPATALRVDDVIRWQVGGVQDKGKVIQIDDRGSKLRVMSKAKGRPFWIPMSLARAIGETADA